MRRQHLDIAIEHYCHWRELGLGHGDMLAAIGIKMREPSAGDVVVVLAEAAEELERNMRWRGAA